MIPHARTRALRAATLAVVAGAWCLAGCAEQADVGTAPPPVAADAPAAATRDDAVAEPATPVDTSAIDVDVLPPLHGEDLPTFSTGDSSADVAATGETTPILRAVRIGRHEDFDRVVFEFDSDGLPQWHAGYLDGPPTDCGTGEEVPLAGDATLQVRFNGAAAHTEAGEPTSGPRRRTVGQASLRELVRTCDFEAEVAWVAGIAARRDFRPRVLEDPSRLVIDIRH